MIAAFLTTVLFAVSGVTGNRASRLLGGTEAHFWRLLLAMLLLAVYGQTLGPGLEGAAFPVFLLSGCIGFGIGDVSLFQAFPRLGSRLSMMMVMCLSSPLAALMEWWWLGTKLSLAEILCGLTILAGVGVALAPKENPHIAPRPLLAGMAFGFLAAFCQGYGAVLSRRAFDIAALAQENVDGISAAYQRTVGGVAVTALCLLVVKRRMILGELTGRTGSSRRVVLDEKRKLWRRAWPWVTANGIAGPALGVSCYQWALKTTPTGVVLPIVALTPLVIIPLARMVDGERPSARSLAGGVLAVIGAVALAIAASRPHY
jgi:drug/metabolite transporter (DMT)-like permease